MSRFAPFERAQVEDDIAFAKCTALVALVRLGLLAEARTQVEALDRGASRREAHARMAIAELHVASGEFDAAIEGLVSVSIPLSGNPIVEMQWQRWCAATSRWARLSVR